VQVFTLDALSAVGRKVHLPKSRAIILSIGKSSDKDLLFEKGSGFGWAPIPLPRGSGGRKEAVLAVLICTRSFSVSDRILSAPFDTIWGR